jgi:hypothetical protein
MGMRSRSAVHQEISARELGDAVDAHHIVLIPNPASPSSDGVKRVRVHANDAACISTGQSALGPLVQCLRTRWFAGKGHASEPRQRFVLHRPGKRRESSNPTRVERSLKPNCTAREPSHKAIAASARREIRALAAIQRIVSDSLTICLLAGGGLKCDTAHRVEA